MRLFDSHAHLTDESFAAELDAVLSRAAAAGVESVVAIASDVSDSRRAIELARRTGPPRLFATAGIHPHVADLCTPAALDELEALAADDAVVAIGETGLDFYYENAPHQLQIDAFRAQLELAARFDLPVVVHAREADDDVAELIGEFEGRASGVLHCFSGGSRLREAGLAAGWWVSFSGLVTFKKFSDLEQVRRVPLDRLLVETDSPYLAPTPKRGRRNEPALMVHTVARLAEIRDEPVERLAAATYENACRLYGVEPRAFLAEVAEPD